jgi:hypothetical protein
MNAQEQSVEERIGAQREKCVEADRKYKLLARYKDRLHQDWMRDCDREIEQLAAESHLARWVRDVPS